MSSHNPNKSFQYASTTSPVNNLSLPTVNTVKKGALAKGVLGTSGAVLGLSTSKAVPSLGFSKPAAKVGESEPAAVAIVGKQKEAEDREKTISDKLAPVTEKRQAAEMSATDTVGQVVPLASAQPLAKKPKLDKKSLQKSGKVYSAQVVPKPKQTEPKCLRAAGGEVWEDATLADWDPAHYRLFVGNLGPEVSDHVFHNFFLSSYPSVSRSRIIKDKHSGKSRGYGFIAFADGREYLRALKEMPGKWLGNRQCIIKKSDWKSRNAQ